MSYHNELWRPLAAKINFNKSNPDYVVTLSIHHWLSPLIPSSSAPPPPHQHSQSVSKVDSVNFISLTWALSRYGRLGHSWSRPEPPQHLSDHYKVTALSSVGHHSVLWLSQRNYSHPGRSLFQFVLSLLYYNWCCRKKKSHRTDDTFEQHYETTLSIIIYQSHQQNLYIFISFAA